MVFSFEVQIEAKDLLPLYDSQCRVESIEVGYLDVAVVVILAVTGRERDSVVRPDMVALRGRAACDSQDSAQGVIGHKNAHANVDERNAKIGRASCSQKV